MSQSCVGITTPPNSIFTKRLQINETIRNTTTLDKVWKHMGFKITVKKISGPALVELRLKW